MIKRIFSKLTIFLIVVILAFNNMNLFQLSVTAAPPADENFDDDFGFNSGVVAEFTLDGIKYTVSGNILDSLVSNDSSSPLGDDGSDYYINIGTNTSVKIEASDGSSFRLMGFSLDALADGDITITPNGGDAVTINSNNSWVTEQPRDLSGNSDFYNITSFTISGSNMLLCLDDIDFATPIIPDSTPPTLVSGVRDSDTQITVTLSEDCTNITKANDGGFSVSETGNPGTTYAVSSIAQGIDASHVVLTVADMGVSAKEGITVTYTAGGNGTIQDTAGNALLTDAVGVGVAGWDSTPATITTGTVAGSNGYIDIVFSEGIYGANDGSSALTADKLGIDFTQNGGTATNTVISSIKQNDNVDEGTASALVGGETTVRVFLTVTGTPDGNETIEITPADGASIYDEAGNATLVAQTTGIKSLNEENLPELVSAVRDSDTQITVTLSEDCTNITKANDGGFSVSETGNPGTTYAVSSIAQGIDASHVVLTVADMGVSAKEGITVTYTAGGNGTIQDTAGNALLTDAVGVGVVGWYSTPASSNHNSNNDSKDSNTQIIVNGEEQNAGTTTSNTIEDKTITIVTVDDKILEKKLEEEGIEAKVVIPVDVNSDVVVGVLNGQTIKNMELKEAVLEIRTKEANYTIPAAEINIDHISKEIGVEVELKDIKINVSISEPSNETVSIVEDEADKNNFQIVVKPVDFEITCTNGEKSVSVAKYNSYVERSVAIPDDIDPTKITTGVVLNNDGTFSHVPTSIIEINGKYFARINSLTNSTYSVIWSPKSFVDVKEHWAKEAVNEMGSRLIIKGVDMKNFAPDKEISRGEFAAIIVRGLGLHRTGVGKDVFTDVNKTDWYYDSVFIAYEYGLINGIGNNKFEPNRKITREESMVIVNNAMKITKINNELSNIQISQQLKKYIDGYDINDWSKESVANCLKNELIIGSYNRLNLKHNITRAEVAIVIKRLLEKSNLI